MAHKILETMYDPNDPNAAPKILAVADSDADLGTGAASEQQLGNEWGVGSIAIIPGGDNRMLNASKNWL